MLRSSLSFFALQMVALLSVSLVSSLVEAGDKVITIQSIHCITPESVTTADKVYFLVNDDEGQINFDSLKAFKATKDLDNGDTWIVGQQIRVDENATVVIAVFDRDAVVEEIKKEVFDGLKDAAIAGKGAKEKAAEAGAKALLGVLKGLKDKDDLVLFVTIPASQRGEHKVAEKKGVRILGTDSEYELTYAVK